MKRSMDVEKLLHWAYRDELSKRQCSSAEGIWDRLAEDGRLGGIGDDGRRGDTGAQRYDFGLPHPDAEAIEAAVGALPETVLDWPASMESLATGVRELLTRDVLFVKTIKPPVLVTTHAIRESRPEWYSDPLKPKHVEAERGAGFKIVGECRGKNLYTTGSYCPIRWEPPPYSVVLARADYAVWHAALSQLAASLVLEDFIALPPTAPVAPWLEAKREKPAPVVIRRASRLTALPLRPQRDRAGPPVRRPQAGPVRHVAAS